jgi:hypothetical protein
MRKPVELVAGEGKFAKCLSATEGDDRGKDDRLDGGESQGEAQRDEPAHRAAKIAVVEPYKRPSGRGDDEAQREERLDNRPTRHLTPRANDWDQGQHSQTQYRKVSSKGGIQG